MKILKSEVLFENFFNEFPPLYAGFVKAVVDVDQAIIAVDADMHVDLEQILLQNGSEQKSLWGINLHQDMPKNHWIEFDSMINLRPKDNNWSRSVEDPTVAQKIKDIVQSWIV
ncbi:MAG TPA: DUF5674 family protein [Patescibacteria group bacterium]|nr:DUF5674 family protein [Patescibacteria group bacterium]